MRSSALTEARPTRSPGLASRNPLARALLAVVLCCAAVAAQKRGTFVATVTGADGKPLAGSEVTCVFSPTLLTPGSPDVVTATTDAHGRARCELRTGLLYVAWAVGPAVADGSRCVSEPIQLVAAGRVADLSAWARTAPRRVKIDGYGAWQKAGATALRWYPTAGEGVSSDLPIPADGTLTVPVSPFTNGCLALVGQAGEHLVTVAVPSGAAELPSFAEPIRCDIRVGDAAGAPVEGATISHVVHPRVGAPGLFGYPGIHLPWLRSAATTDAAGKASFCVPTERDSDLIVHASKPGFGWASAAARADARIALSALPRTSVTVIGAGDAKPMLGAQCEIQAKTGLRPTLGPLPGGVEAVDAMRWLVHAPATGFTPRLWLEPSAESKAAPTAVVLDRASVRAEHLEIDLGKLHRVEVRVTGPDGGPPGCALAVARVRGAQPGLWEAVVAADTAGRATLLLPDNAFFVYATSGSAHALELVDLASRDPLALRLEPLPTMRLRVEDAEGKPVAGARAHPSGALGARRSADTKGQQWARVAFELGKCHAALPSSGADGTLCVPVFLRDEMELAVVVLAGARRSAYVKLEAGGERTVVVR